MRGGKKEMKPEVLGRGLINPTMAFFLSHRGMGAWGFRPGLQAGKFAE